MAVRATRNTADITPTPAPTNSRSDGGRSVGGTFGYSGGKNTGMRTAPTAAPVPGSPDDLGGGGYYDGGVVGGGGGIGDFGQLPTMAQTDDDWLAGDSAFQAQLAALLRASQDYDTDVTAQKTKYGVDYNDALKGLGWNQDDPATADVNEGAWNFKDLNTAAGRSFQNQQNDFAGRGLLQSSLYGTANDNLTRSLNDQLGGINTAKQTFFDDLARQQSSFKNENTLSQQQARAEALARRAASIV